MKKILSLILVICLAATIVAIPATARFNDVASNAYYRTSVERLANLGIIGGVGGGYFSPHTSLTRAQFARIATIVAGNESEVIGAGSLRRFSDVDTSHWASGYINTVARHGIITGFPGGYYLPENPLNFAEAVTITLRLLGWDHEDLGHNWPAAYINKARELGLTAGVEQDAFETISRANIAVIINRALDTQLNSRQFPTEPLLITRMGFTQTNELMILATRAENASLLADEIMVTGGLTFRTAATAANLQIPLMATVRLILDRDNRIVDIVTLREANSRTVTVAARFGDSISYTTATGASGSIQLNDNTIVFHRGNSIAFSQLPAIEAGSEMVIYYTATGAVEFVLLREPTFNGPYVVRENVLSNDVTQIEGLTFQPGVRVIRDGFAAQLRDIRRYDVVYFAPSTNTLHVYIDRVSGVYERAYPTKAAVTSIVLSGRHLQIETATAANRLGENPGSLPIGARFTALLGRNGGIVDVVNMTTADLGVIAVILSTESRISTDIATQGRQEWFTTVMTGNGTVMEFLSDRDYADLRGRTARISFDGELARFGTLSPNVITGAVNQANRTIGGRTVPQTTRIIEVQSIDRFTDATARVINFSDIPHTELTNRQVIHAEVDATFGDITLLIVENVTMSQYTFGYMTRSNINTGAISPMGTMPASGNYTIVIEGVAREFTSQGVAFTAPTGPVAVRLSGGAMIESLRALNRITTRGGFEAIDFSRIRMGGENFLLASDVQIYRVNRDSTVSQVSLADMQRYGDRLNSVQIFSDTAATGGLVRIVTFRT